MTNKELLKELSPLIKNDRESAKLFYDLVRNNYQIDTAKGNVSRSYFERELELLKVIIQIADKDLFYQKYVANASYIYKLLQENGVDK
ncbi:hypothetical protein LS482_11045 [Sinomicrobium kalidii]|uniref:hypothetical protein n=1 Tax=Sinomicrobium kalidii TaxID=2900738 RepID=UPI001E4AA1CD|nr:hypothetical protein [Sinomicrobium kalidii]UGU14249.1 hypothetical protein LS482_11045 [Sinomicrobium kalidii]